MDAGRGAAIGAIGLIDAVPIGAAYGIGAGGATAGGIVLGRTAGAAGVLGAEG
jgi:hypothetical protein